MRKNIVMQNERGLSLVETLFSIAIILVVSSSFYQLLSSFYQNYEIQEAIAETQQQSRVTTDLFWQEVRNTGLDPTGALFAPANARRTKKRKVFRGGSHCDEAHHDVEKVFEATPTMFHFLADLNQNGIVDGDDPEEQIRYEWIGAKGDNIMGKAPDACGTERTSNALYRDSGGGMYPVASNIVEFDLTYYDEGGIQLPKAVLDAGDRARIRRIVITLLVQTAQPLQGGYRTREMQTHIWLRNL